MGSGFITLHYRRTGMSWFSSSISQDKENPPTHGTSGKKLQLKSGKTTKLTSHVVLPHLWPHSQLSLAYESKDKSYDEQTIAGFLPYTPLF